MSKIILKSDIPVTLIQHMGSDRIIAGAAWASTNGDAAQLRAEEEGDAKIQGLIGYLMKQKHGTPFEHGSMTFAVSAPIFQWREHHRHRVGFSYNEQSGRYGKLEPIFWVPRSDRPIKPVDNYKSARPMFEDGGEELHEICYDALSASYQTCYGNYEYQIEKGVALEVARACLPVSIYSTCWVTCNPRSLMHFLALRTHDPEAAHVSYPQREIEEVARQYEAIFAELFPITYAAFVANGRVAP